MGKPAARIGDPTAHGGSIVLGYPTVLIGGAPAARLTDMHVCPMVTPGVPPIPHVGGPIMLGSAGVMIGGLPAARLGDMATCVGPPDSIIMGCPTVLIGEIGSGAASGGGGGGGSAPAVKAAQASAATAQSGSPEATSKNEHWIEIEFVDTAGNPVSGIPYQFKDPDGKESESTLRLDGTIRRDGISEGQGKVVLQDVYGAKWDTSKIKVDDKVKAQAKVDGFENGTPAEIQIFQRDIHGADTIIANLKTKVKSGKIEANWRYEYPKEATETNGQTPKEPTNGQYSVPEYYFEVIIGSRTARSAVLSVDDTIELELLDGEGNPVKNQPYILRSSSGEIRKGNLDGSGKAKEENIPPAKCVLVFPELPNLEPDSESFKPSDDKSNGESEETPDTPNGHTHQIQLCGEDGKPLSGEPYVIKVDGQTFEGNTDRNGWTEIFKINGAEKVEIESDDTTYTIKLKEPSNKIEKVQSMLNALGYRSGELSGKMDDPTKNALRAFQRAQNLEVTGELNDITEQQLEFAYAAG